jgi:hypothetical protein
VFGKNKRELAARKLPARVKDQFKNSWQLADVSFLSAADSVSAYLAGKPTACSAELLKKEKNRVILRIATDPSLTVRSVIAKIFPIESFAAQLKYYRLAFENNRYGFGEAHNLIVAAENGLRVPSVCGYGTVCRLPGLVNFSVVLLDDFGNLKTMHELFEENKNDQEKCLDLLRLMNSSFVRFYRAGCRMVNYHSKDAVLDDKGPILYDFEYAIFDNNPNVRVLLFEMASFTGYSRQFLDTQTIYQWVLEVVSSLENIEMSEEKILASFDYFFKTRLSRKDRLEIC